MSSPYDDLLPAEAQRAAVAAIAEGLAVLGGGCEGDSAAALRSRLHGLTQVARMVEGHTVAVVVEADRAEAFRDDGHVSAANWFQAETNGRRADALRHGSRTAALVASSPVVGDELRAGRVGIAQVHELARARANPRIGDRLDGVIEPMLEEARREPFHIFERTVRAWEALVDADGAHEDHDATHAGRRASVSPLGSGGVLHGTFGAAHTAELMEILQRFTDAEFEAEWTELRARLGDDACPALLERSDRQRRADAVVAIFRRAAAADPSWVDPEPVVNLIIPQDVFEEQLQAMVEHRAPEFDAGSARLRLCTTANGVPVDPAEAVAAALVGRVRRVVVNAQGVIINFGRRARVFTGAAREAALLQAVLDTAGRCLWPGCGRHRIQLDHADEWQRGGATDLANSGPLCGRHNRLKTRGYRTWRDSAGGWHVHRPDGTEIAPAA